MKKTLRLTALVMAVAIIVCAFAGCGAKIDKLIVSGTYKVDTEADPATVTIVPEIAIAGFKAGTEITFTA